MYRRYHSNLGSLTSEEEFQCAAKGAIPLNSKSSNEWALRNLHIKSRNSNSNEKVPEDLLSCPNAEVVCKWLYLCARDAKGECRTIPTCTNALYVIVFLPLLEYNAHLIWKLLNATQLCNIWHEKSL